MESSLVLHHARKRALGALKRMAALQADINDRRSVTSAAKWLREHWGSLDILVNNAGIEYNNLGSILTMPQDKLEEIIKVNLLGPINVTRAFAPLLNPDGRVVNISSVQALAAHLPGTSYQASKAGILGLTRALALELASRRIVVNTVVPGAIATEGMGAVRAGDSAILDPYRRRIPAGRRGRPEEVASVIAFLASNDASYITGTEVVVDGGYLANITPDIPEQPTPWVPEDPDL